MSQPAKGIWISYAKTEVETVMLKPIAILSPTNARRSTVKWKDLNPYWNQKKDYVFQVNQQVFYL